MTLFFSSYCSLVYLKLSFRVLSIIHSLLSNVNLVAEEKKMRVFMKTESRKGIHHLILLSFDFIWVILSTGGPRLVRILGF